MRWSERQRAMLREMGVQLWSPRERRRERTAVAAERAKRRADRVPASADDDAGATTRWRRTRGDRCSRHAQLAPADWLVVGEPFDGAQQEQLLDNMLRAIGVARSAPARERRATFVAVAASARSGDRAAICGDRAVAPRCIVALGRAAAAAVLGSDAPLGHWRGRRPRARGGAGGRHLLAGVSAAPPEPRRRRRGPTCASPSRASRRRSA